MDIYFRFIQRKRRGCMNIIANNMVVFGVLLLASVPAAMAQSRTDSSNLSSVEYRAGQLWTTGQGITVTVLAIEDVHRVGKIVHVRIENIPYQSCGDIHLTRAIEHIALTENMMRKSDLYCQRTTSFYPSPRSTLTGSGKSRRSIRYSKCRFKARF
jgi:hypothetical protein